MMSMIFRLPAFALNVVISIKVVPQKPFLLCADLGAAYKPERLYQEPI